MRIFYKPTQEAIQKLRPKLTSGVVVGDPLEQVKTITVIYAMQDHKESSLDVMYADAYYYLKRIYNVVRDQLRKEYYNRLQENEIIAFDHDQHIFEESVLDYDHLMSWTVRQLLEQIALCPTADYYEEQEKFEHKERQLDAIVGTFVEAVEELCRKDLETELAPFKYREEKDEYLTGFEDQGTEELAPPSQLTPCDEPEDSGDMPECRIPCGEPECLDQDQYCAPEDSEQYPCDVPEDSEQYPCDAPEDSDDMPECRIPSDPDYFRD